MKSLTSLWRVAASELAARVCVSTDRDFKTVTSRVEDEGLSFLTITLPAFCADFERSLANGCVAPDAFQGFHRPRHAQGLPAFMRGFLELIFDPSTGDLLDISDRQIEAIFSVRQLTLMFGKILVECSDTRQRDAIDRYVECEQGVREFDSSYILESSSDFIRVSSLLFREVLAKMDRLVYEGELIPRHGPGATADKLRGNSKFEQLEWPTRLETYFPYGEYALPNWRFSYLLDRVNFLEPGEERPVKVTLVPKTLKTPRIIAIEPTCMQYAQQAVAGSLIPLLEQDDLLGGLNGLIGFSDQTQNQRLAMEGSLPIRDDCLPQSTEESGLATLDLSEASDRVSNLLVLDLTRNFPWLSGAIQSCRSMTADVPGYGITPLAKFASMGSALCFPIEAMVFLTVVLIGIERELGRQLTRKEIKSLRGSVRVYGDDIIVPAHFTHSVIATLESFGFKVNARKSFWTGLFRESCGKEFYAGHDVSICRVRRVFPSSRRDVLESVSLVSLRNRFYDLGLWKTASYLDELCESVLGHFPTVHRTSPVLGRISSLQGSYPRWSPDTQSPLVKGFVIRSSPPASSCSGEAALLKVLINESDLPIADEKHLERYGRPDAVNLKLRWASPF